MASTNTTDISTSTLENILTASSAASPRTTPECYPETRADPLVQESDRESVGSMPSMETISDSDDETSLGRTGMMNVHAQQPGAASASPGTIPVPSPIAAEGHHIPRQAIHILPPSLSAGASVVSGIRMLRRASRDGAESDGSLPSLQTVSESSDLDERGDSFLDSDSDDDEDSLPALAPPSDSERRNNIEHSLGLGDTEDEDEEDEDEDWEDEEDEHPRAGLYTNRDLTIDGEVLADLIATSQDIHSPAERFTRSTDVPTTRMSNMLSAMRRLVGVALGGSGVAPQNDNRRAKVIMKVLEEVPPPLVTRYEKLRRGHSEEDCEGCAVCRDVFLQDLVARSEAEQLFDALPFNLNPLPDLRILAFPCPGMHLFHASCIAPWLARKTTCPTCRFDIDPDSLTLHGRRDVVTGVRLVKTWQPQRKLSFKVWLEIEERRQAGEHVLEEEYEEAPNVAAAASYDESDYADDEDDDDDDDDEEHSPDYIEAIMGLSPTAQARTRPQRPAHDDVIGQPVLIGDLGISRSTAQSMMRALDRIREAAIGEQYDERPDGPEYADMPPLGSPHIPGFPHLPYDAAAPLYDEGEDELPPLEERSDNELPLRGPFVFPPVPTADSESGLDIAAELDAWMDAHTRRS